MAVEGNEPAAGDDDKKTPPAPAPGDDPAKPGAGGARPGAGRKAGGKWTAEERAARMGKRKVVGAKKPKVEEEEKREPPDEEMLELVHDALKGTFGVAGSITYKLALRDPGCIKIKFDDDYADALAQAWTPLVARFIGNKENFFLWFVAVGGTGVVGKQIASELAEARKGAQKPERPVERRPNGTVEIVK